LKLVVSVATPHSAGRGNLLGRRQCPGLRGFASVNDGQQYRYYHRPSAHGRQFYEPDNLQCGSLPPGLSLQGPNGILSGTPKQFGNYSFALQVKDSSPTPETATVNLTMTVNNNLAINTTSLPQTEINKPYSQIIAVTGGLPPYTLTISAGSLPPGLALNAASGAISGTPTKVGAFNFTVAVADSENPQATNTLTITTTILPTGVVGEQYSAPVSATGGIPPYKWAAGGHLDKLGLAMDECTVWSELVNGIRGAIEASIRCRCHTVVISVAAQRDHTALSAATVKLWST
jgi:hypothetical protein